MGWGLAAAVLVAAVAGVEVVLRVTGDPPWPAGGPTLLVAVAAGVLVWRFPRAAYRRWSYDLAATTLELRRGVVFQTETAIPYFRVQHIDITRSPVERALGLSQLVVRTAAASTDATIPGIAAGDAEELRDVILARTGRDDV